MVNSPDFPTQVLAMPNSDLQPSRADDSHSAEKHAQSTKKHVPTAPLGLYPSANRNVQIRVQLNADNVTGSPASFSHRPRERPRVRIPNPCPNTGPFFIWSIRRLLVPRSGIAKDKKFIATIPLTPSGGICENVSAQNIEPLRGEAK
jgi:hypothetical protein